MIYSPSWKPAESLRKASSVSLSVSLSPSHAHSHAHSVCRKLNLIVSQAHPTAMPRRAAPSSFPHGIVAIETSFGNPLKWRCMEWRGSNSKEDPSEWRERVARIFIVPGPPLDFLWNSGNSRVWRFRLRK